MQEQRDKAQAGSDGVDSFLSLNRGQMTNNAAIILPDCLDTVLQSEMIALRVEFVTHLLFSPWNEISHQFRHQLLTPPTAKMEAYALRMDFGENLLPAQCGH